MGKTNFFVKQIAYMGLMLSMIITLSLFERMLPPISTIPGISLGLSNVIILYSIFFLNPKRAYMLAVLKSVFVIITRGLIAGFMSISGGIISVTVMVILFFVLRKNISYIGASVCGAVAHNLGQIFAAVFILSGATWVFYYIPMLIISGIIMGTITGAVLKALAPALNKIYKK